jgi:hypothetical protein
LQRYIQVDIDDIFVGQKGTRLTPSDVEVRLFKFIYHYQISFHSTNFRISFTLLFKYFARLYKVNLVF